MKITIEWLEETFRFSSHTFTSYGANVTAEDFEMEFPPSPTETHYPADVYREIIKQLGHEISESHTPESEAK